MLPNGRYSGVDSVEGHGNVQNRVRHLKAEGSRKASKGLQDSLEIHLHGDSVIQQSADLRAGQPPKCHRQWGRILGQ